MSKKPAQNGSETAPKKVVGRPFVAGQPSANPGGRPKLVAELKERALKAVEEVVIVRWVDEVTALGPNWVKCSELLAAYGMGKPKEHVEVSDVTDREEQLRKLSTPELLAYTQSAIKGEQ